MLFDWKKFEMACCEVSEKYMKSAPTVSDWAEFLCARKSEEITLAEIHLLSQLQAEDIQPNYAANMLYHLQDRLGQSTVGHAGF